KGIADFDNVHVGGQAFFRANCNNPVTFAGLSSFESAVFDSDALFSQAVFKDDLKFDNSRVQGVAEFTSADFAPGQKPTFIGARFGSGGQFDNAHFNGRADFSSVIADRDMQFGGAVCADRITFNDARFHVVFFGKRVEEPQKLSWRALAESKA